MKTNIERIGRGRGPAVVIALVALGALLFLFRGPLVQWFAGPLREDAPSSAKPMAGGHQHGGATAPAQTDEVAPGHAEKDMASHELQAVPAHRFSDAAIKELGNLFAAYEAVRKDLANDNFANIAKHAKNALTSARAAGQNADAAPHAVHQALDDAGETAARLGEATDIDAARAHFSDFSHALVRLAAIDTRLREGRNLFECPMVEGYGYWMQPGDGTENPYMGSKMPTCGGEADWKAAAAGKDAAVEDAMADIEGGDEIAYYTCSMHPSVRQPDPGKCPICNMDLQPVTKGDLATGVVTVDEVRRQQLGIRTETIARRALTKSIRAVGVVAYDETRLHDVTTRIDGWVEKLRVDSPGQRVGRGQTLFELYSPEIVAAQEELLIARARGGSLENAARRRLRLFGIADERIDAIIERGSATDTIAIPSPASGFVVEKMVIEGMRVMPGEKLYRIADLSRVWIDADVYENDLPFLSRGQKAEVSFPYFPGETHAAKISEIYPYLEGMGRTAKIRLEIANPKFALKPDMYANVTFEVDSGEHLAVPVEAVIYTGPRRLVFIDLGQGRLRPKEIQIGARYGEWFAVRSGLAEGEIVVSSGNFLIAAESRIRSAAKFWRPADATD
ncbi:efflux RND transporter periplasmic adaptor subunit [bacterium]|nr:efflux RND transporter periplasmic adaptor subunit [bacterium]